MPRKDFPLFGERCRALRKERDWKLEEVAERLQIERVTLNRYELGLRVPESAATLRAICRLYGVSSDYLLGLVDGRRPWVP